MNLPLQMRAVSRGRFSKSQIVNSAGRVLPSWTLLCDPPMVACSCNTNGNITTTCCAPNECTCDGGTAGCQGGRPGHHIKGKTHLHSKGGCTQGPLQCNDGGNWVDCNS
jgi:hypothetical protein